MSSLPDRLAPDPSIHRMASQASSATLRRDRRHSREPPQSSHVSQPVQPKLPWICATAARPWPTSALQRKRPLSCQIRKAHWADSFASASASTAEYGGDYRKTPTRGPVRLASPLALFIAPHPRPPFEPGNAAAIKITSPLAPASGALATLQLNGCASSRATRWRRHGREPEPAIVLWRRRPRRSTR
jgi:hypothetical protein